MKVVCSFAIYAILKAIILGLFNIAFIFKLDKFNEISVLKFSLLKRFKRKKFDRTHLIFKLTKVDFFINAIKSKIKWYLNLPKIDAIPRM